MNGIKIHDVKDKRISKRKVKKQIFMQLKTLAFLYNLIPGSGEGENDLCFIARIRKNKNNLADSISVILLKIIFTDSFVNRYFSRCYLKWSLSKAGIEGLYLKNRQIY